MIKLFTAANAAILLVNVFTAYLYLSPSLPTSLSARPHCHGQLAPLEPREWTLHDLRQHDGVADKRILIAVDWRVFDVTRGAFYYGPSTNNHVTLGRRKLCLAGRERRNKGFGCEQDLRVPRRLCPVLG